MKLLLTIAFASFFISVSSQESYHIPGMGFESFFQKQKEGIHQGSVMGMIEIKASDGNIQSIPFLKDSASLQIVYDKHEIYDVSTKIYSIKKKNMLIEYKTYARANSFKIELFNNTYRLNIIDGACSGMINGLDYEYINNNNFELLILHFEKEVGLSSTGNYNDPDFHILKGSTLLFKIYKE